MHAALPFSYTEQIALLSKIVSRFTGLTAIVFPNFVEYYGLEDQKTSLKALALFTRYSTAEFAIRPFLAQNPDTIKQLYKWSTHKNMHVRRLASEGCRPLLPWAMKNHQYVKDPSPLLAILKTLRNDPENYVYRSVANNMNDISKHHPDLMLDLAKGWISETETTRWVCKHGLRTLLKKGNQTAMQLFGFGPIDAIQINTFGIASKNISIGNTSELSIILTNNGETAKFRLEYAVGYLKKNGTHNEKVFQLKETLLSEKEQISFKKKVDFKNLSTRRHYPGEHYVYLKVNGIKTSSLDFKLSE